MRVRYIVISVVVLVLVALVAIGVVAGNVDKYRPKIQSELQEKLGRQVTLGHLGLSFFPLAVRAEGVTVADAPEFSSTTSFATAKALDVSVGLFSLIGGNPEVKQLVLDQPQIELIRNKAGIWNFSTIGGQGKSSGPSGGDISLNELKIKNGQVAVTDQMTGQPRAVYQNIDLELSDFAPGKKFGLNVAAHFPGQGKELLSFKGKAGPLQTGNSAATPIDGHVSLQEVSLAAINRLSPGTLPPQTDGVASGDADITSQGAQLSAKGDLKLQNAVLQGSKLDFPIDAKYDLSANRAQNSIQIRNGSLQLGAAAFTLAGDVDAHATPANLNVRLTTKDSSITDLARLAGAFGVAFDPAYQVKGNVTADITARGPSTAPQLSGSLSAKQLVASGGEIKQPVSVPQIDLALSPDAVKSNNFTVTSGATSLTGSFALSQYTTTARVVDATLRTDNANIAELLNMAKAYGVEAAKGTTGSGKVSANLHVTGPLADSSRLNYSGTAMISAATFTTPTLARPVEISSANAQFSQNSIAITNFAAKVGSTSLQGNVSAKNFAAPDVQFALTADKIDTEELNALIKTQPAAPAGKPAAAATASAQPSLINVLTGSGTLAATSIKADDIVLSNLRATAKINKGVITLSPLTADIFGGKEAGTLSVDVRPAHPLCSLNAKLTGVDTNAMLSAVSTAKNTLYGSLAADTNLRFSLVPSDALAQTLNGTLQFNVTNGELKNVNILGELSKVGRFLGSAPSQSGSGTALHKFSGSLSIVNGVASTDNLTAVLDAGSLAAKGSMNLANQGLNLHMTAALSSTTSQVVGGTKVGGFLNTALANNKGELVIPVIVAGTMAHPTFTPDAQALAQMKLNNLLPSVSDPAKLASGILSGKGAGGILNNLLGGQPQQGQPQQGQPQQNSQPKPQDAINSILNSFGKKTK